MSSVTGYTFNQRTILARSDGKIAPVNPFNFRDICRDLAGRQISCSPPTHTQLTMNTFSFDSLCASVLHRGSYIFHERQQSSVGSDQVSGSSFSPRWCSHCRFVELPNDQKGWTGRTSRISRRVGRVLDSQRTGAEIQKHFGARLPSLVLGSGQRGSDFAR